jgi:hypothetical protein
MIICQVRLIGAIILHILSYSILSQFDLIWIDLKGNTD